jgi:hypothetical protein
MKKVMMEAGDRPNHLWTISQELNVHLVVSFP